MARVVLVIASRNFRDEELFHTKEELNKAGHSTVIASTTLNECEGMLGGKAQPEKLLEEISPSEFDAIVFVGGSGATVYFGSSTALNLAKEFNSRGKLVCAICLSPSILANAGLLNGKKATSFPSEQANLEAKGAIFTGENVSVDGKIVTANGPNATREFGKKIAELLK